MDFIKIAAASLLLKFAGRFQPLQELMPMAQKAISAGGKEAGTAMGGLSDYLVNINQAIERNADNPEIVNSLLAKKNQALSTLKGLNNTNIPKLSFLEKIAINLRGLSKPLDDGMRYFHLGNAEHSLRGGHTASRWGIRPSTQTSQALDNIVAPTQTSRKGMTEEDLARMWEDMTTSQGDDVIEAGATSGIFRRNPSALFQGVRPKNQDAVRNYFERLRGNGGTQTSQALDNIVAPTQTSRKVMDEEDLAKMWADMTIPSQSRAPEFFGRLGQTSNALDNAASNTANQTAGAASQTSNAAGENLRTIRQKGQPNTVYSIQGQAQDSLSGFDVPAVDRIGQNGSVKPIDPKTGKPFGELEDTVTETSSALNNATEETAGVVEPQATQAAPRNDLLNSNWTDKFMTHWNKDPVKATIMGGAGLYGGKKAVDYLSE